MFAYRASRFLLPALAAVLILTACRTTPPPQPKPPVPPKVQPTPTPVLPPCATMSLRTYLKQQLGPNFHTREEWAGTGPEYAPQPYRNRVWAPIGNVFAVTIHHAEMRPSEDTAEMIRSIFHDHTNPEGRLDAADVGYHFFVDVRGQVWEGRDASRVGTHVGSRPPGLNNPCNLGICGLGSFVWQDPPQVLVDQAATVAILIAKYYGRPMIVRGHHDWSGINGEPNGCTTCPGRLEVAVSQASQRMQAIFPTAAANTPFIATAQQPGGAPALQPARPASTPVTGNLAVPAPTYARPASQTAAQAAGLGRR
jgi:hypothetical protein